MSRAVEGMLPQLLSCERGGRGEISGADCAADRNIYDGIVIRTDCVRDCVYIKDIGLIQSEMGCWRVSSPRAVTKAMVRCEGSRR